MEHITLYMVPGELILNKAKINVIINLVVSEIIENIMDLFNKVRNQGLRVQR